MQGESAPGADAQQDLPIPRAFGQYLIFDRIGHGGMAQIYLARTTTHLGGSRRVVIKEVLAELSADRAFARMLTREAKLAAQLSHRNIVQVMDLGRESGRLFIAMEYVEGYDLNQLLRELTKRRIPLPVEFALFIVREVLAALDYAHRATDEHGGPLGVVHRDVSPSNVLISFEGEVNLCDFGIARALSVDLDAGDDPESRRIRVAGKSAYMSPEHAAGREVDSRSDVFAGGILLWELCAGRRLYKGTEQQMLEMARAGQVQPLPERGLPEHAKVQGILDRALQIDPAARYQSAAEMLRDLDDYAMETRLMASQLRFASFLTDNFAEDIVAMRRARERAAEAALASTDLPVRELEPITLPSEPPGPQHAPRLIVQPRAPSGEPARSPQRRPASVVWGVAIVLLALGALLFSLR
jgi:serine/threonine-protein kinase